MRVKLENGIRGLLMTFGVTFGKRLGGFKRRAEEIIEGDRSVAPELVPIFEALMQACLDGLNTGAGHLTSSSVVPQLGSSSRKSCPSWLTGPGGNGASVRQLPRGPAG